MGNFHKFLNRFGSLQFYSFVAAVMMFIWSPRDREIAVKIMASNAVLFFACVFLYVGIEEE